MTDRVHISRHPLIQHKLTILRNKTTDHVKFQQLVRELALLLCCEATQDMALMDVQVETPMGMAPGHHLTDEIGLVPILRAGLGMVNGLWDLMPSAKVWHIGLYRDEKTLRPVEYYNKLPPDARVQICFILDPMLALTDAHSDVDVHLAALDDHLNEIGYIVPGLGDAGDRQFGTGS
jgi:uracil phosphoribosyltransferase